MRSVACDAASRRAETLSRHARLRPGHSRNRHHLDPGHRSQRRGARDTLSWCAMSKDASAHYHQRLHALDLTTGAELLSGPVGDHGDAIRPPAAGRSAFSPGPVRRARGLALLSNGTIYTSWTSHCDIIAPVFRLDHRVFREHALPHRRAINVAANRRRRRPRDLDEWRRPGRRFGGATSTSWTANGAFETTMDANGFPSGQDYGKQLLPQALDRRRFADASRITSRCTTRSPSRLVADQDLGSGGGEMLLPDLGRTRPTPSRHLVVGAGKDGNIYVVNRDSMGKFNSSGNTQIWQDLSGARIDVAARFLDPGLFQRNRLLRRRRTQH